jgi:hypothetical protein
MANPNGNPQNLRPPWQPGERVPGAGRPRKRPLSEAYDSLLRQPLPEAERKALGLPKGTTWAEAIAAARARHALRSSGVESAREMREAVEGKATQRFELMPGEDRTPEFVVVYASPIPGLEKVIDVVPEEKRVADTSSEEGPSES